MSKGGSGTVETSKKPYRAYTAGHDLFGSELLEAYGNQQEFFPGSTVEARSADTSLSFDMLREFTTGNNPSAAAGEFLGEVMGGDFMPGAEGNPYLDDVFDVQSRRVTEAYQRTVMPTLNSRFAGAGRSGQGAHAAGQRGADRTLGRTLGDLSTEVYYGDYERRMGDRFKAAGMSSQVNQSNLQNIGALRALGQDQESYEARLLGDAMQRHQFAQQEPEARLDRMGQRLGVGSGFGTQTQPAAPQGNAGLSAGLGIMSMIATIMSDIRVKKNIERVGETPSGIPIYTFDYKEGHGPAGRYEGVMAQDLIELAPDAVAQMPNGYLGVQYDMIDADFRRVDTGGQE